MGRWGFRAQCPVTLALGMDHQQDTEVLHYAGIRTRGWHCVWGTNRARHVEGGWGLWYRAHVSDFALNCNELYGPGNWTSPFVGGHIRRQDSSGTVDLTTAIVRLVIHPNGRQYGLDTRDASRMARGCPVPAHARR